MTLDNKATAPVYPPAPETPTAVAEIRISRGSAEAWNFFVPLDILPGFKHRGFLAEDEYLTSYMAPGLYEAIAAVEGIWTTPEGFGRASVRDVFHGFPDGTSRLAVSIDRAVDGPESRIRVARVIGIHLGPRQLQDPGGRRRTRPRTRGGDTVTLADPPRASER
jgi:hypothetical protein